MLDNIKYFISLKTVDKCIKDANYDLALEKLNALVKEEFMPAETFLKRGRLCRKLLMYEEAYSDFTYIITHCAKKQDAYQERMLLNFEMSNFEQSISDANKILDSLDDKTEVQRIIFLSLVYLSKNTLATEYILNIFESNKYKAIHYILTEVAKNITEDNLSKALKLLAIIDIMDSDNPIKLFNEASIYGIAGDKEKEASLLKKLEFIFPKYFVSHFKFTDIYEDRDLFFIGRGIDYAMCEEGSLKLKEVSYTHSDAYQAGELKHGTISLIEDGVPVFAIITDEKIH
jgi:tetratricopeptide (TPR) repeat protein